jgi:hypothetical protein
VSGSVVDNLGVNHKAGKGVGRGNLLGFDAGKVGGWNARRSLRLLYGVGSK